MLFHSLGRSRFRQNQAKPSKLTFEVGSRVVIQVGLLSRRLLSTAAVAATSRHHRSTNTPWCHAVGPLWRAVVGSEGEERSTCRPAGRDLRRCRHRCSRTSVLVGPLWRRRRKRKKKKLLAKQKERRVGRRKGRAIDQTRNAPLPMAGLPKGFPSSSWRSGMHH